VLKNVQARAIDSGVELIDVRVLSDSITTSGVPSQCFDSVTEIQEYLWREIPRNRPEGEVQDVIFVMSNGSFDGLNQLLQSDLK
jgi:hypothetical protein